MSSKILLISGSDSSAGAGHQADLRTVYHYNLAPLSALTAITVQSDDKAAIVEIIAPNLVKAQIDMAICNCDVGAVKIGMLGNAHVVDVVSQSLLNVAAPIILDPVLATSSGRELLSKDGIETLKRDLLPQISCLTPNLIEAGILSGIDIENEYDIKRSAEILLKMGPKNVIIKGGHGGGNESVDYVFGEVELNLASPRYAKTIRGSGCSFATSIACNLAKGEDFEDALNKAKEYVSSLFKIEF